MSDTPRPTACRSDASFAELAAVAASLVVAVVAAPALAALSAGLPVAYAWARPLNLDEFHTLLLVEEPTIRSMIAKLAEGGDYNPPGLFFVLRPWTTVFGTTEPALRAFSTTVMVLGLFGLYVALRKGTSRWPASAATLAAWGGLPLLQTEAVDARFYALWFATAAWLAAVLPTFFERGGIGRAMTAAGLSVLMCLSHYFGVLALIALAGGQLIAERLAGQPIGRSLPRLWPTLAGPAALAACLPLYLGQRAALEVPTWLAPSGRAAIEQLIDPFFRSLTLAGAALVLVASIACRAARSEAMLRSAEITVRPLGASLGLLGLPFVLLAFHFVVQPVSVARYAIPAVIGVAAAAAVLLACCDRKWIALGVFALMPAATLRLQPDLWDADRQHAPARLARTLVPQTRSGYPLVFAGRGDGYSAWRYSGLSADAIRLAYPDGEENVSVFDRLERSVARRMKRLFGTPAPIGNAELLDGGPFVFSTTSSSCDVERRFPEANVRRLAESGPMAAYLVTPAADDR
ncbi:MAG: glycosyltransferase family 39 protein [Planctomycetaceae bacterium]